MTQQDISKVSARSAKNISEGAYSIGQLLETVAAFNFQTDVALNTVSNLIKVLEED
jgi:DNA-binding transcriptional regulator YhcF (GntR family)